jgi:hypothetical protein
VCLVVDVGRHRPLLSGCGRPRDGPALARSAGGQHPRCDLSGRQPPTVSHDAELRTPTVCIAPPPLVSATLLAPSTRASRDCQPVTTMPEPSAWGAAIIRASRNFAFLSRFPHWRTLLAQVA